MAHEATRAACFQPNEYQNIELFADRYLFRDELAGDLRSFLDPDGPGQAYILLRGDRGVGKSMLARRVMRDAIFEGEVLQVVVDCARTSHGIESVLRDLAATLAKEAIQNASKEYLRVQADILLQLSEKTKVRIRDVKNWSSSRKLDTSVKARFADRIQFEFGMSRASGRSREVEELSERTIDASFLRELISAFLLDCRDQETRVLLLVDNLDQAGFAEVEEDIKRVTDLARYILTLQGCVVIATLRTEFASGDLTRLKTLNKFLPRMSSEELCEVVSARIKSASAKRREALQKARFEEIAQTLSKWTGNTWAFLGWLEVLDYASFDAEPNDSQKLKELLLSKVQQEFARLRSEDLRKLGEAFEGVRDGYRTVQELNSLGVDEGLLKLSVQCSALIPDYLLSPQHYVLSPVLHFLVEVEKR